MKHLICLFKISLFPIFIIGLLTSIFITILCLPAIVAKCIDDVDFVENFADFWDNLMEKF